MSLLHRNRVTPTHVSIAREMLRGNAEPKTRRQIREATLAARHWTRILAGELEAGNIMERHGKYEMTKQGRSLYKRWDAGLF